MRRQGTTVTVYLPGGEELTADTATATAKTTARRYYTFAGRTVAVRTAAGLGNVTTLVSDAHATADVAINNATNAVTWRRTDPFGNPRATTATWPGDHGFLDKPTDTDGLTQVGARYYDPTLGRFISVDPLQDLGDPQQWNGYAYANNNPVTNADPTGMLGFTPTDAGSSDVLSPGTDTGVQVKAKRRAARSAAASTPSGPATTVNPPARTSATSTAGGGGRRVPTSTPTDEEPAGLGCHTQEACAPYLTATPSTADRVMFGIFAAVLVTAVIGEAASACLATLEVCGPGAVLLGGGAAGEEAEELASQDTAILASEEAAAAEEEAANTAADSFGAFGRTDLRSAAQAADRNGLTRVGRALQKHSGRDGSIFRGLSTGNAAARNEEGLRVLDEILDDPGGRTEVLDRVTNIWDSTGRGVRYSNDGSFMGFLEPVG